MARMLDALWRVDSAGLVVKPNCSINLFLIVSMVVFSCQEDCVVSDLICL